VDDWEGESAEGIDRSESSIGAGDSGMVGIVREM
jgi:hypothetical protein